MPVNFFTANMMRQEVILGIREFFVQQGFQEITVPLLWSSVPLEPHIYPFVTQWQGNYSPNNLFLPISPEKSMKAYLASGAEKCFTISHCFRNLEDKSSSHHPEFLMLEWYRPQVNYEQIMMDAQKLILALSQKIKGQNVINYQGKKIALNQWLTISIEDLWQEKWGLSLQALQKTEALVDFAQQLHYQTQSASWEQLFHQIFLNEIEPNLPAEPFFLIDFPLQLSPLCAPSQKRPWCAERFEVYIDHLELGNGNTENLDVQRVNDTFQQEYQLRIAKKQVTPPVDQQFLQSLRQMKKRHQCWAGMGLGVDRLTMILFDLPDIGVLWPDLT